MPASAATWGRTAASLRAAIAFSAEVSVSTIQNHADMGVSTISELEACSTAAGLHTAELAHGKRQSTGGLLDGEGAWVWRAIPIRRAIPIQSVL